MATGNRSKAAKKRSAKSRTKRSKTPKVTSRVKPKSAKRSLAKANSRERKKSNRSKPSAKARPEERLLLPDRLDSSTAEIVLREFISRRGRPLVVDAAGVRRVGAQSLQILVSAGRTWKVDGMPLSFLNPSKELLDAVSLLGLQRLDFAVEGLVQ